jgi:2-phospho-L-lactate guanylyltransferase
MLKHVLATLRQCPLLDGIAVLSAERDGVPTDTVLLADAGGGVNRALRQALKELAARGAKRVAIVSADLPFLAAHEVEVLVASSDMATIAIAPDRHATGTNALVLPLTGDFCLQFGPGSLYRHQDEARRLALACTQVCLPGLQFDVDDPTDLALLQARDRESEHTQRGVSQLRVGHSWY